MKSQPINKSGFVLLDKSTDITSHRCLGSIKKRTSLKVGHTGTLDPMATGAMIVAIGDATKFSRWIIQQKKCYTADIQLGSQTDTDDRTGKVLKTKEFPILSEQELDTTLQSFVGTIEQTPPLYSAIHIDGKRAYDLARNNIAFSIPKRTVTIDEIKLLNYQADVGKIKIEIICQSGTYIRSIARDLGEKLQTFAHLSELHREWIAPFKENHYRPAEEIESEHIITLDTVFQKFPKVGLNLSQVQDLFYGKTIELEIQSECAAFYQQQFIGIIAPKNAKQAKSIKLISQNNINSL
jgi:tRNA pseudouridine55 synthase